MIFVSVGAERFPFDRLIEAADRAIRALSNERMFMQVGHSRYIPRACVWTRFLPYEELVKRIEQARVVVSHAGVGSLLLCARAGKVPIVVPRHHKFKEHVDDHQVELARRVAKLGYAILAEQPDELVSLLVECTKRAPAFPQATSSVSPLAQFLLNDLNRNGHGKVW
jgi:UDP-N-acetylglucosamine transferase subunit ALG13